MSETKLGEVYRKAREKDPSISKLRSSKELTGLSMIDQTNQCFVGKDKIYSALNNMGVDPDSKDLYGLWEDTYSLDNQHWNGFLTQRIRLYLGDFLEIKRVPLVETGRYICPVHFEGLLKLFWEKYQEDMIKSINGPDKYWDLSHTVRTLEEDERNYSENWRTMPHEKALDTLRRIRDNRIRIKKAAEYETAPWPRSEKELFTGVKDNLKILALWKELRLDHPKSPNLPFGVID